MHYGRENLITPPPLLSRIPDSDLYAFLTLVAVNNARNSKSSIRDNPLSSPPSYPLPPSLVPLRDRVSDGPIY